MTARITAEQVQSDVESYAMRASPDGRLRVIGEALDKARREGGEDARAEVARLREVIATKYAIERSSLGVSALIEEQGTIATAAGLPADASAEEVRKRVSALARTLSLVSTWRHEHGVAGADQRHPEPSRRGGADAAHIAHAHPGRVRAWLGCVARLRERVQRGHDYECSFAVFVAMGQGKLGAVLQLDTIEPELMYREAAIVTSLAELLVWTGQVSR